MGLVLGPTLPNLAVCGFRCSLRRRLLLHSVSRVQVTKIPALEGGEGSCSSIMQGKKERQRCVCVCAYMYMCACARIYMWVHVCMYVLEGNGYGIVPLKAQNRNPEFSVFYFHLERRERKLNIYKSKKK